uniref:amidohydrolase n=1 Tax=Nonomuraea pusilla TaxID=46177 RepID=UPI000B0FBF82|nr:amidohydrolase [Nonomuraea pusilla]
MLLDLRIEDANVVTMDAARPSARAIGIWDGRVVGLDEEIDGLRARETVRADGATVLPGFVDAHTHLAWAGRGARSLDISGCTTREEILATIARHARTVDGEWIDVVGYDQRPLGRHLTAAELDPVTGGRKAFLLHRSGHACLVNTAVLHGLSLTAEHLADPDVLCDEHGEPTGVFLEAAQAAVHRMRRPYDLAETIAALRQAAGTCLAQGVTACGEAGIVAGLGASTPIELLAYQRADLPIRVQLMVSDLALHPVGAAPSDGVTLGLDLGMSSGFGGDRLWLGAMKMWLDGGVQARTAALSEPFCGTDNRGALAGDEAELRRKIVAAHASGWQLALHAIGDRAIDVAIEALVEAQRAHPRPDARHRIEHCGIVRPDQLPRLAECGAIAVVQPEFLWAYGDDYAAVLGETRAHWQYRGRGFLDAGVPVAGSSDRPVVGGAPLRAIEYMVRRRGASGLVTGPGEAITVEEALHAYTMAAAHALGRETVLGSISPRKWADLVVLGDDPRTVPADRIAQIEVRATYVAGEKAHG